MLPGPAISVVITTRNRRQVLLRAIESSLAQEYVNREVIVLDDASTDGTSALVARRFPEVRLVTSSHRRGLVVLRNVAARMARGSIIVSIDDDAYFTDTLTLRHIVREFVRYPQAGALALPFIEPRPVRHHWHSSPSAAGTALRSYIGCAHAVRRDVFLSLGSYRDLLVHQGEERDFCIRVLDAGREIILANTPPIVHDVSPVRDHRRMTYYGYRNTLLFSTLNVPQPMALLRMIRATAQLLRHRPRRCAEFDRLRGLLAGWLSVVTHRRHRRPVRSETVRRFQSLAMHQALLCRSDSLPHAVARNPAPSVRRLVRAFKVV